MDQKNYDFPYLPEGEGVKNLKGKIEEIGRPSIFIGSVSESIWIAELAQSYFDKEVFEADAWPQGVFELTKTNGGKANNAEQLKNFTDIYDFAIFIFSQKPLCTQWFLAVCPILLTLFDNYCYNYNIH